jgi:hypothetical protein
MATTTDYYHKAATQRLSNDDKIVVPEATLEAGVPSHGKLVAPPLVAAMSAEERTVAEAKLRRKIDTRLLPMIILVRFQKKKNMLSKY